jgi:hypothetical protein
MSAPTNLTPRNNPEVSTKLANPQKMYSQHAASTPGQTASVDALSTIESMEAIDRRTGKSRLFAMETPGEVIQKQQGAKGILSQQQSLLTGGQH